MNAFKPNCLVLMAILSFSAHANALEFPATQDDPLSAVLALDCDDIQENYSAQNAKQFYDLIDNKLLASMDEIMKSKGRTKVFYGWNFETGDYA